MFGIGDVVTTTVHMIGNRSEDVSGTVTAVQMSRKVPGKVVGYTVDASAAGYGMLAVEAGKAR